MIHRARFEQWLPVPLERVFQFFSDPLNLPRLMPPELAAEIVGVEGPPASRPAPPGSPIAAGPGTEIRLTVRLLPPLPFRTPWLARIVELEPGRHFADVQVEGPFRSWSHRHEFERAERGGQEGTLVRDDLAYEVGFGRLGDAVARWFVAGRLRDTFRQRQRRLEELLRQP